MLTVLLLTCVAGAIGAFCFGWWMLTVMADAQNQAQAKSMGRPEPDLPKNAFPFYRR